MDIKNANRPKSQKGATIVEFTLALILLVSLIGVLIDFGLTFHNYMLLRHVTERATREVVLRFNTRGDCDLIQTYLDSDATHELRDVLGADIKGAVTWRPTWISGSCDGGNAALARVGGTNRLLRVTGSFGANCYFLCGMFPNGWTLTSTSEAIIDRRDVECLDACPK